jgi:hypothetical protein
MLTPEHESPKTFVLFDVSKGCLYICRAPFAVFYAFRAKQ